MVGRGFDLTDRPESRPAATQVSHVDFDAIAGHAARIGFDRIACRSGKDCAGADVELRLVDRTFDATAVDETVRQARERMRTDIGSGEGLAVEPIKSDLFSGHGNDQRRLLFQFRSRRHFRPRHCTKPPRCLPRFMNPAASDRDHISASTGGKTPAHDRQGRFDRGDKRLSSLLKLHVKPVLEPRRAFGDNQARVSAADPKAMLSTLMTTRRFAPLFWCQFFSAFNDNFLKNSLVFLILSTAPCARARIPAPWSRWPARLHRALLHPVGARRRDGRPLRQGGRGAAAEARRDRRRRRSPSPASGCHSLPILFLALVGFGVIAALFGPIKYGILPDHLATAELPAGNALVEGATFLAILIGTIVGGIAAKDGGDPAAFGVADDGVRAGLLGRRR